MKATDIITDEMISSIKNNVIAHYSEEYSEKQIKENDVKIDEAIKRFLQLIVESIAEDTKWWMNSGFIDDWHETASESNLFNYECMCCSKRTDHIESYCGRCSQGLCPHCEEE